MSDRFHSAFISYKHDDVQEAGQDWAGWIEQQLEGYLTPTEFVGTESIYKDPVPARLVNIFRDKQEIPGMGNLDEMLHSALKRSRSLIVLCSPGAASSRHVEGEVRYFKSLGHAAQIIALILDGKPHSKIPGTECLPPSLGHDLEADGAPDLTRDACPVYIDLRSTGTGLCATSAEHYEDMLRREQKFTTEYIEAETAAYASHLAHCRISLISGVLGLAPGKMTERERLAQIDAEEQRKKEAAVQLEAARRRTRVALAACCLLAGFLAAAIFFAWKEHQTSAALAASLLREEKAGKAAVAAQEEAQAALAQLRQKDQQEQRLRAESKSDRAEQVRLGLWGTGLSDADSRATLEKAAAKYENEPPADADSQEQDNMAACYNRLGDILFGLNSVPLSTLEPGPRADRLKAHAYYLRAIEANLKAVKAAPLDARTLANLATTYHRSGIAYMDMASIHTGDKATEQLEKALEHLKLAEKTQFKATENALAAAPGKPVTAWYDANTANYQTSMAVALDRLSVLQTNPQAIKSLRREAKAARTNALENFTQAIQTANQGAGQVLDEATAKAGWQSHLDAIKTALVEDDKVLEAL